ncbi:hypothetical protein T4B_12219 [Trichinella pseudospiralis]|uniref:Uncharacterized protein n=1 Tax=Trichinella pseudospiralis TaxID=6337 RepID=A0A0V1JKZ7_TRIPS|nr:hypothetical protein T4A_4036 [Trichinella pseudospiralis]KRZ19719.1 hypothetical protein T4B_12219 [Trichinella pseudospiralis]KRZ35594.1 hypothetical protein T4C_4223 [Trichinella pseudospiralis]
MNYFCLPTQIILIYCAHLHSCAPLLDYNSQQFQIVNCSNAEKIVKFIQNVSSMKSLNQKNDIRAAISCTLNSVLDRFLKKDFQLKKCQWIKMENLEIDSDHLLFCFEEKFVSTLKIDFYKNYLKCCIIDEKYTAICKNDNIQKFYKIPVSASQIEFRRTCGYSNIACVMIIKKWKRSNNSKITIRAKRQYFIPNAYDVYSSLGGFDIYDHQAYTVGTMDSLINDLKNVCRFNNPSCDILSTEDILHSAFWTRMPPNIDAGYINDRAAIAITAI